MERKTSILIVDDDRGMRETMQDILVEHGFDVEVAEDGNRAIGMMKERAYDIAFMDIKMPGINGVETYKKVKSICPETKVMMMTAFSVEDLIKEALKEGAYGVFHKPLDINRVLDFIQEAERGTLILVVDDDQNICDVIKDVLNEKGYRVKIAYNGEEAIRFAEGNQIDIVMIDVKMPALNGLETYRGIRKVNKTVTAIMMTGYRSEVKELVAQALEESACACLYKPLDMDTVIALVKELSKKGSKAPRKSVERNKTDDDPQRGD